MTIGETLSEARRARGLTVDQVAQAVRTRATLIRAIEADDFAPCGGTVYARGHLRNIAGVLGLDPAPLVAEFDREHNWSTAPMRMPGLDRATAARAEPHRPNWSAAMAAVLVVVSVVSGVHLVRSAGTADSTSVARATSSPTAPVASPAPPSKRPSPPPSDAVALIDPNSVTVQVRITGAKSWVSVTDSTRTTLFQGVLTAGTAKVFRDPKQLRLILGNAGAVDLVVNGRDLGRAGRPGAVTHAVFNRGDPAGSVG